MKSLLSIAHTPPTTVTGAATVQDAVDAMVKHRVGAAAIVEHGLLAGIFTERDLMKKVVALGKDPRSTPIHEVMTREVQSLAPEDTLGHAFRVMTQRHFRHMPVCDPEGRVLGMVSIRHLLYHHVERLALELDSLEAFLTADGPGG